MKTKRIAEFALSFSLSLSSLFSVAVPKVHAATSDTGTAVSYVSVAVLLSLLVPSIALHTILRKKSVNT